MRTKVRFLAGALPRRILSARHSSARYAPSNEVKAFGAFTMSKQQPAQRPKHAADMSNPRSAWMSAATEGRHLQWRVRPVMHMGNGALLVDTSSAHLGDVSHPLDGAGC